MTAQLLKQRLAPYFADLSEIIRCLGIGYRLVSMQPPASASGIVLIWRIWTPDLPGNPFEVRFRGNGHAELTRMLSAGGIAEVVYRAALLELNNQMLRWIIGMRERAESADKARDFVRNGVHHLDFSEPASSPLTASTEVCAASTD